LIFLGVNSTVFSNEHPDYTPRDVEGASGAEAPDLVDMSKNKTADYLHIVPTENIQRYP
jgi:hypothetical protein